MIYIIENWDLLLITVLLLFFIGFNTYKFITQPSNQRLEQVKIVLLHLVTLIESEYGSKTGKIKFAIVYSEITKHFKWLQYVPNTVVEKLIEDSLEEMKHLLSTNEQIKLLVEGDK